MTRRAVSWSRSARRDLERIVLYLADRSLDAAASTLDRIEARAAALTSHGERGRIVPQLARMHVREYRELVIAPYRLVYRIDGARVVVLAVLDARRNLEDILIDRLLESDEG